MGQLMGRRLSLLACAAVLSSSAAAHAGTKTPASWAAPQIRAVAAAGLMGATNVQAFRGSDPLTAQALENLVFDIKTRLAPAPEAGEPGAPVGQPTVTVPTVTDPTATTTSTTTTATTTTTPAPATPP